MLQKCTLGGRYSKTSVLELKETNGFTNMTIQKEKAIIIPDDILQNYLSEDEIRSFKNLGTGIFSITVYAEKPLSAKDACCQPEFCN